ncbi:MAG: glycosyl transferase, partial [Lachnospiraceae bacterium]|nr:glycosyl transferase [Lachnospiraceae bacterium]
FKENKRPFHNFGNSLVRNSINSLFKSNIKDIMTGYRAFSYRFVKTFPVLSKGFEIETEMSIHAVDKNMYVENVVIEYKDRPQGSTSKLNTYSDGFKVLRTIMRLYRTYRPSRFFGLISSILMLLATGFMIPIIIEYIQTGLVPRFPTLIVCGFVVIAAIQSFFSGQILKTIYQKNRQDFEIDLYKITSDFNKKLDRQLEQQET